MKILILVLIAAFTSVAIVPCASSSVPTYPSSYNMTGFYLGLHGGQEFTKDKIKSNTQLTVFPTDIRHDNIASKKSINSRGTLGGIHLGYQHDFGKYLIGLELSSTYGKNHRKNLLTAADSGKNLTEDTTLDALNIEVGIDHKNSYGSALRLGYKIMPQWVAGIKLGYVYDRYNLQYSSYFNKSKIALIREATKKEIHFNSFAPGIYVEKFINNHLIIGAEYNYMMNKKQKVLDQIWREKIANDQRGRMHGLDGVEKISFKPNAHDLKVRLGYKF